MKSDLYTLMRDLAQRPAPFSRSTVRDLWTRPWLAKQMLDFHVSQDTDLASRRKTTIDRTVDWIDSALGLSGKTVCDLGCGAGLYARRLAAKGADVTGIDFSTGAIAYARAHTPEPVRYRVADYLADALPSGFDLVTLIYYDYCVMPPSQRAALLTRMRDMLNLEGHIVFDVVGMGAFEKVQEHTSIEERAMDGFWAEGDYVTVKRVFVYPSEKITLDRYLIVEPDQHWDIFNWLQYFTPESIGRELNAADLAIDLLAGDLTGRPLVPDGDALGIIASRR
ncbi:class I SAM-dependent methyltransferase [Bauldia sp.]|uniref:class I SAM-dependent methyltransferase n=1 Tax=Bauldia sp. TaxID=2575872 RepID=UPI003BA88FE1